jgi:hypothetical protein
MRERGQWLFEISPQERVTIRLVALGLYVDTQNIGVWLDGNPMSLTDGKLEFTATKAVGQIHVVMLECNFTTAAAPDASFAIWIRGTEANELARTIRKTDNPDIDMVFSVVVAQPASKVVPASGAPGPQLGPSGGERAPGSGRPVVRGWNRAEPPRGGGEEGPSLSEERRPQGAPVPVLPASERLVNVGFSAEREPSVPLSPDRSLASGGSYYFWLQVGPLIQESLESERPNLPVALPVAGLPGGARLQVVLFTFPGELESPDSARVGELKLEPDGSVSVARQPLASNAIDVARIERRPALLFPIRAPAGQGAFRLRCNIYHRQTLLQSRLIEARVTESSRPLKRALRSTLDYTLTKSLAPPQLEGLGAHRLSVMLNENGQGNVGLRFFGEQEFKADAAFDDHELQDLIAQARAGLRRAAWGDEDPWTNTKAYRYDGEPSFDRLKGDLVMLAKKGYAFYDTVIDRFSGGPKQSKDLAALMRVPGQVQIALKESPRHILPAGLLYDYPLDNGLNDNEYAICPAFGAAYEARSALENIACFQGQCPSRARLAVVCPSGFWGYRHFLGFPLSLAKAPDLPQAISWTVSPSLIMAASTDLELTAAHHNALDALKPGARWSYADSRDAAIRLLKSSKPHIVYFYCHGGLDGKVPYLRVGPRSGPRITGALFRSEEIQWDGPRPLIFINGCHTTALEPEQAIELVSSFVAVAQAWGVIGTETTVFEKLARPFAEVFLTRFLVDARMAGDAVRSARLALLAAGNPLGLTYIPFVTTSLRMVEQ